MFQNKAMKKALSIIIPVLICFAVGLVANYFQSDAINNWYPYLNKPASTPPDIVFPIAWNLIYLCIGISVGLIILSDIPRRTALIRLFAIQLVFNFLWSILFFYFRSPLWGLIDILILDILVTVYFFRSYPVKKASALLFVPYLLWIYFATYLNGYILMHN